MSSEHSIKSIHHVSLLVGDLEQSKRFYRDLLNLEIDESRPDKGFPGAWINVGKQQIHLIVITPPEYQTDPEVYGGRTRHFALQLEGLESLKKKLDAAGVAYSSSKSGRPVVFCRDPDGNVLELIDTGEPG